LIGVYLLDLHPELIDHPDVRAALAPDGMQPPVTAANQSPAQDTTTTGPKGELAMITAGGQTRMYWFGNPPARDGQSHCTGDVASLAEEAASRMKSEFIANINHEVRTPMNAIIGYTEMLANAALGPKEKRFVAIIHKSSMALVSIFNDIMELSKIDAGRLQIMVSTIRLQSIIDDVDGLFKDVAEEKGIHLYCRLGEGLPQALLLDGVRLKQVLQNLVGNAIKFTPSGSVSLRVDGTPSTNKPGCLNLSFAIEDTGIGIPEDEQQKILELFRQREDVVTKKYGGVGLGLTLCSRLAVMMGGWIELVSRAGEGTLFTLILDGVQVAKQIPAAETSVGGIVDREREHTLLVVDDVDLIKDVFLDFFQGSSYRVLTASSGEEALALARAEHPDIIFMDLNLGGTDGRSVTGELRRSPETTSIPVVLMTGEILDEAEYRPLFDALLQKPFRLDELLEIVTRLAGTWPGHNEEAVAAEGSDDDERLLALGLSGVWSEELESMRLRTVYSGSLTDAAALGAAMRQHGMAMQQPMLSGLGEELLLHAGEPNILGVDRLLAKLSRIANSQKS
jgi:signal transduction histidine kinase/CheY-like chemotaxis protein